VPPSITSVIVLYLIATPIGNLEDITLRAINTLKLCEYILCEDTRHSRKLLDHYQINKPLKSYHRFNEKGREEECLDALRKGLNIALISDAGTPGISDPGMLLVRACQRENLPYTTIPGPCAAIAALTLAGFDAHSFQFVGFLPKKSTELDKELENLLSYSGTTICYEAPHRILETLQKIAVIASDRKLCIARELTKTFEECLFGTASELLQHFSNHPPRGEMVLLFAGAEISKDNSQDLLNEDVRFLQERFSLSLSQAIKAVAKLRGHSKRDLYRSAHDNQDVSS